MGKASSDVFVPDIVQKIAALNHEIGYHYEDLLRNHGNYHKDISDFEHGVIPKPCRWPGNRNPEGVTRL